MQTFIPSRTKIGVQCAHKVNTKDIDKISNYLFQFLLKMTK